MAPPDPKILATQTTSEAPADLAAPPASPLPAEPFVQGPPPAALSAAPTLATMMHAFRHCWKRALLAAVVGGLLAAAAAWLLSPTEYISVIEFRILQRPPQGSLENEDNFANVQKAQVALMKSHEILKEAIDKSKADELYGVKFDPLTIPKKMTVNFNAGAELAAVSFAAPHPEAASALLNALAEVYTRKVAAADEARIRSRIAQLKRRLESDPDQKNPGRQLTLAEQLHDLRTEKNRAEKKANLLDPLNLAHQAEDALSQLRDAQKLVFAKRQERLRLESEILNKQERIKNPSPQSGNDKEAVESIREEPAYINLKAAMERVQKDIEYIGRTDKRPDAAEPQEAEMRRLLKKRNQLIEKARQALDQKALAVAQDNLDAAKREEETLKIDERRWAAKVQMFANGGPPVPPEVLAMRDKVAQKELELKTIGGELAALEGALPLSPRVTSQGEAFVPTERDTTKPLKYTLGAGVGAFGLLLVGVCLLETRGRRIYASSDVAQGLGIRVVGALPRLPALPPGQAANALAPGAMDAQFGMIEAVDAIRTVLMHSPRIDGARVVMITSAVGGEGKTTLASHLATSLSRAWRKTLLIDGDLRNPAQHLQFDQPLEPGLSEALRGEVEFEDAVKPTLTSRLWLMPAGKIDGHSLQALAQEGVSEVFDRLKEQYDFIVIDTSPVLPVPDALLLGKHADAVLLAVMRDVSRLPAVYGRSSDWPHWAFASSARSSSARRSRPTAAPSPTRGRPDEPRLAVGGERLSRPVPHCAPCRAPRQHAPGRMFRSREKCDLCLIQRTRRRSGWKA